MAVESEFYGAKPGTKVNPGATIFKSLYYIIVKGMVFESLCCLIVVWG